MFQPYSVTLTAIGGTPPYTWGLVGGNFPGLSVSADGVLSGTPAAIGPTTLRIQATDSKGDSHAEGFDIRVDLPTTTPSPTRTSTPTPTATPSVTPTPTVTPTSSATATASPTLTPSLTPRTPPCAGDCNMDGTVTVDELIKGVNIALDTLPLSACASFDANGNGVVTVDEIVKAVNAALLGCP